jgi:hypothetical protein
VASGRPPPVRRWHALFAGRRSNEQDLARQGLWAHWGVSRCSRSRGLIGRFDSSPRAMRQARLCAQNLCRSHLHGVHATEQKLVPAKSGGPRDIQALHGGELSPDSAPSGRGQPDAWPTLDRGGRARRAIPEGAAARAYHLTVIARKITREPVDFMGQLDARFT